MSKARAALLWLDDRVNPLALMEIRRLLRGGFLSAGLYLYLLGLLLGTLFSLAFDSGRGWADVSPPHLGRITFSFLANTVQIVAMWCVPAYLAIRLGLADKDEFALVKATRLTPQAVVRGELLAGCAAALVPYLVAVPFLVMSYFLGGISAATILRTLGTGILLTLASVAAALMLGFLMLAEHGRIMRVVVTLIGFVLFFPFVGDFYDPVRFVYNEFTNWRVFCYDASVGTVLAFLPVGVCGVALFYSLSCAAMARRGENAACRTRLTLVGLLALLGLQSALMTVWYDQPWIVTWHQASQVIFLGVMAAAVSQRDEIGPLLRQRIPRIRLARLPSFLLCNAAGGVLLSVVMIEVTVSVTAIVCRATNVDKTRISSLTRLAHGRLGLCFVYCLAAVWLRRRCFRRIVPRCYTWLLALALFGATAMASMGLITVASLWDVNISSPLLLAMGSPTLLNDPNVASVALRRLPIPAALLLWLNRGWFGMQLRAFRPLDEKNAASEEARADI